MERRRLLGAIGGGIGSLAAGCLGLLETESVWSGAPLVEDRPDAVYRPASTEEMGSYGTATADDGAMVMASYTFPHRFWTVTGEATSRVEVSESDSMHLMVSIWDPETGLVLPRDPALVLTQDGRTAERFQTWSMLSQRMGYHFGNNVEFPGEGAYRLRVDLGPIGVRTTGALAGRFEDADSATISLEFDSGDVTDLSITEVDRDRRGERAAIAPMEGMAAPVGRVPPASELPGERLGSATAGDATFLGCLLPDPPRGVDGDGPYLAVSPRTPYNRYALPSASLSADVGGRTVRLVESIGDGLGHHYGAAIGDRPSGDVGLSVSTPPQVARHDGYETAFFEFAPVTL